MGAHDITSGATAIPVEKSHVAIDSLIVDFPSGENSPKSGSSDGNIVNAIDNVPIEHGVLCYLC